MKKGESANEYAKWIFRAGLALVVFGVVLLVFIFFQAIKSEVGYLAYNPPEDYAIVTKKEDSVSESNNSIVAANKDFSLIIPKLGVNSKVVADVDPNDEIQYRAALKKGIAHAKGTSVPDKKGRVFLFAHSSDNFYNQSQSNTIFYLLRKLEKGDDVWVVYDGLPYDYSVKEIRYVNEDEVEYLAHDDSNNDLVLMTCWPPGTSYRRLLVFCNRIIK